MAHVVICEDTRQLGRHNWLEYRKAGLGASDAAASVGLSPWVSEYQLYQDKLGLLPEEPQSPFFAWRLGIEDPILDYVEAYCPEITGALVRHQMLRSVEYPWMQTSPDGWIPGYCTVQAKTAQGWDEAKWDVAVPDVYVIQVHHEMIVLDVRKAYIPVTFGMKEPRLFEVAWDQGIADALIRGERAFWTRVLEHDPPDIDGSDATRAALAAQYDEPIPEKVHEASELVANVAQRGSHLMADVAKAYKEIDKAKAICMQAMGDAELLEYDGEVLATWRLQKNGRVFRFSKEGK